MSNPFGDHEDDEKNNAESEHSIKFPCSTFLKDVDYDSALDPFAEENEDSIGEQKLSTSNHHRLNISSLSRPKKRSDSLKELGSTILVANIAKVKSTHLSNDDRLSLNSSSNSLTSVASESGFLTNFSLGFGSLQKEGLLCPDCMVEFRTITELMDHSDHHHGRNVKSQDRISQVKNLSINLKGTGLPSFSNELVSDQIKSFISKLTKTSYNRQQTESPTSFTAKSSNQSFISTNHIGSSFQREEIIDFTSEWEHSMKLGFIKNHYEHFRLIRDSRIERYVFETNKLLICLDKLIRHYPPFHDLVKRREHEQSVVDWIDETIVPLCPSCAQKFNILTKKKHHCRLCGAVMCSKCSAFIDFDFAYSLINPISLDSVSLSSKNSSTVKSSSLSSESISSQSSLSLSSSISSPAIAVKGALRSLMNSSIVRNSGGGNGVISSEQEDRIRVCFDCKSLLVMRKEKMEIAHCKPEIVKFYEQLRETKTQINRCIPIYFNMSQSLNDGESTFSLKDANDLKQKITRSGETADFLSRQIECFGVQTEKKNDEQEHPTTISTISKRQLSLQVAIRRSTVQYLRDCLLSLPELPDERLYEQLKQQHAQLIEKRILWEKKMALLEQERFRSVETRSSALNNAVISIDDGFCPQISTNTDLWQHMNNDERDSILNESDPMVQQMNIIKSYLRQARDDHRYEEVAILEANLHELEIEFYFKQQQQNPQLLGQQSVRSSHSLEDITFKS